MGKEFIKLDNLGPSKKGADGNELDQFWSAKFIEDNDVAMTAIARKEALRAIDQDNNGCMAALEYFIWKYNKSVSECANAPQGSLTPEQEAELEAAQEALTRLAAALETLKQSEEELKEKQAQLKAKQAELDQTVADLKALEKEQQDAVDAFEAEEAKYKKQCDDLRQIAEDPSVSTMKKSKANNELQQLLAEDPLPLRKAKITQEAVVRKVQREQKPLLEALA